MDLSFLDRNLRLFVDAPVAVLSILSFSVPIAYLLARREFNGTMETMKQRIEHYKDIIKAKDEQIIDYRQKSNDIQETKQSFVEEDDLKISGKALKISSDIRSALEKAREESNKTHFNGFEKMRTANDEAERQRIWNNMNLQSVQSLSAVMEFYSKNLKIDAIILRDEMRSRLPPDLRDFGSDHSKNRDREYEHPVNTFCLTGVADDLERLAKLLQKAKVGQS